MKVHCGARYAHYLDEQDDAGACADALLDAVRREQQPLRPLRPPAAAVTVTMWPRGAAAVGARGRGGGRGGSGGGELCEVAHDALGSRGVHAAGVGVAWCGRGGA